MTEQGVTLEELAAHFCLSCGELASYGCRQRAYQGKPAVAIPYLDESGATLAIQYRTALQRSNVSSDNRFRFRVGDKARHLYGLHVGLSLARSVGWALLVEGASDCWVCWHYDIPALGIPGKSNWQSTMASDLNGLDVYVWQEPDAEELPVRIARELVNLRVIVAPPGIKDIACAHIAGIDVPKLLGELRGKARSFAQIEQEQRIAGLPELRALAGEVLDHRDPLELLRAELGASYGGDVRTPLLIYLAATTRLLALRAGAMPCHMLVIGVASIGKSYAAHVALSLLPEEAKHVIDAGSPRVLIYDDAELEHRLLVFGEVDSLPAGEDNPAASALRGLLQDNRLHYKVTVRDPSSGDFVVAEIDRAGPTAFLSTSTRSLPGQLGSRVFNLEVPDDEAQICAALDKQAQLELEGTHPAPPESLLAFQRYLQALAPFEVVVPFVAELAGCLKSQPLEPRIMRDFQKLLSLIKAAAIVRHRQRARDGRGRLMATIDDYAVVFELVAESYRASGSGAGERIRQVVGAVASHLAQGNSHASQTDVVKLTGLSKAAISGRVNRALRGGWLINDEAQQRRPAKLRLGEPLPMEGGLPSPGMLAELIARSALFDQQMNSSTGPQAGTLRRCSAVQRHTGQDHETRLFDPDEGLAVPCGGSAGELAQEVRL